MKMKWMAWLLAVALMMTGSVALAQESADMQTADLEQTENPEEYPDDEDAGNGGQTDEGTDGVTEDEGAAGETDSGESGEDGEEEEEEEEVSGVTDYAFSLSASSITYGMALSESVLDASGSTVTLNGETVPATQLGRFEWREPGRVPAAGAQSCYALFVPNEDLGVAFSETVALVEVHKARPVIAAAPQASPLVYGQSLSQSALQGGAAVNPFNESLGVVQGVFEWELRDMVPSVGLQDVTVLFTPIINDADLYEPVYFSVQVEVSKLPADVTAYPAPDRDLVYGETLSALSLTGGRAEDSFGQEVSGTFRFANGDQVLPAGVHTVDAVFTPMDHAHMDAVPFTVQVTVEKAPVVLAAQSAELTYGQTLSEAALSGTATDASGREISGTWQWAQGELAPSVAQSGAFDVIFTPDDGDNYLSGTTQAMVQVHKKQLFLAWGENGKYQGEADGAFAYHVPELPEGYGLEGAPVRESGEQAGEYEIDASSLTLPAALAENHLLIKENGRFVITRMETGARAQATGEGEENGWYTQSATLTAPAGYEIAFSEGGSYQQTLSLPESASGTDYYLRAVSEHAGAVCGPYTAEYKLDTTAPQIQVAWLEGNEFVLQAQDALSGVDRIYGLFAGPTSYYDGAQSAQYAYAARETGNYTYVVHDRAGHTSVVTLDFDDTDGDGLVDVYEWINGTSEFLPDTDGDGVGDFDARRIRNLLGYDRLDVTAAVLLGALADGGAEYAPLPEGSTGMLTLDEHAASRPGVRTFRGLMRVNARGAYGLTGDILWYEDEETGYSAMHVENLTGEIALGSNAPGGLMALCVYENGSAAGGICVADIPAGRLMRVSGSAGAERFDLSPDGQFLAYLKAGKVTVMNLSSGAVAAQVQVHTDDAFRFDLAGNLVMDSAVLSDAGNGWTLKERERQLLVTPLAQPLRGHALMRIGTDDECYIVRAQGRGEWEKGQAQVTLMGVCKKAEPMEPFSQQVEQVMNAHLPEMVSRTVEERLAAE